MATRTASKPAPAPAPSEPVTDVPAESPKKRHSLDDFANMAVAATEVDAPVADRTVPDSHPLVGAVRRSIETGKWIKLDVAPGTDFGPLTTFLRRIAKENFGKGLRVKTTDTSVTFLVTTLTKRGRKAKETAA